MMSSSISLCLQLLLAVAAAIHPSHGFDCSIHHHHYYYHRMAFGLGIRGGAASASLQLKQSSQEELETNNDGLLKLYTLKGGMCPYAARTWITLLELDLPFESIDVSPMKKEDWFLEINPRGKVPALQNVKDGSVVYESTICDEYLVDLARDADTDGPQKGQKVWKLMPLDPSERAALRLLNDHVDTQLSPAQFTFLMNKDTEKDAEMLESLEDALLVLEDALEVRGGPFLMGKDFTLADIHVLPFFLRLVITLKHYKGYDVPKDRFARLLEWYDLCSQRESVSTASKSVDEIIQVYNRFFEVDYAFGGLNKNKN